ncbi:uncharacterized protein LOC134258313 [Saccostrea cucullata]|uniref:uncharacterized protein LOC134258313 n=1 Tax=Saccostrea cuccullata TaxID=36930 RepID=UPI002ED6104D
MLILPSLLFYQQICFAFEYTDELHSNRVALLERTIGKEQMNSVHREFQSMRVEEKTDIPHPDFSKTDNKPRIQETELHTPEKDTYDSKLKTCDDRRPGSNGGKTTSILLFSHLVSGVFVIIGINAVEQAYSDKAKTRAWVAMMISVSLGLISLIILIVSGCRRRLTTEGHIQHKLADPSLKLRIIFLWIFGLAVMVHVSIYAAIYIECIVLFSLRTAEMILSMMSNVILLLFLLIELSFISYYQSKTIIKNFLVNISSIFILVANFVIWFNIVISNISVFQLANNTVPRYSNESYCFRTSNIQHGLAEQLSPILLPMRMEFCILGSSFIISFLGLPFDSATNDSNSQRNQNLKETINYTLDLHERKLHQMGRNICVALCGVFINLPILFATVLLVFAYNWNSDGLILLLQIGECVSTFSGILTVYICSYHLNKNFSYSTRQSKLTTNEYILILTSSGMVTYYMFGLVTAFSNHSTPLKMFLCSRLFFLIDTFLQTHLLIKVRRYPTKGKSSNLISSGGIILMSTNLIHWFLNSYNQQRFHKELEPGLVGWESWLYIQNILVPLMLFYRFYSGISAYSLYYMFKPKH